MLAQTWCYMRSVSFLLIRGFRCTCSFEDIQVVVFLLLVCYLSAELVLQMNLVVAGLQIWVSQLLVTVLYCNCVVISVSLIVSITVSLDMSVA